MERDRRWAFYVVRNRIVGSISRVTSIFWFSPGAVNRNPGNRRIYVERVIENSDITRARVEIGVVKGSVGLTDGNTVVAVTFDQVVLKRSVTSINRKQRPTSPGELRQNASVAVHEMIVTDGSRMGQLKLNSSSDYIVEEAILNQNVTEIAVTPNTR